MTEQPPSREHFLERASLHQRLSAMRHRHVETCMEMALTPSRRQYLDWLMAQRQMHHEIARDFVAAAEWCELTYRAMAAGEKLVIELKEAHIAAAKLLSARFAAEKSEEAHG